MPSAKFASPALVIEETSKVGPQNSVRTLTSLIEGAAIENRDSYAVGKPLQRQLTGDIELHGERQAAAFAQPEKHWALASFPAQAWLGRLSARRRLESKKLTFP